MLFDKDTKGITAILDYNWSYVSHPFDEFMFHLNDISCNITQEDNDLNTAIISGDFTSPANLNEESAKKWDIA